MSRCDYDTIFQRVFCVTLMAIAFTFTVILTNVFIDIDGLLTRKDKVKAADNPDPISDNAKHLRLLPNAIAPENYYTEKNYDEETEDNNRSKRSLESQNFLFHIKNPKMKSILTSRLATLLEELDQEEDPTANKDKVDTKSSFNKDKVKEIEDRKPNYKGDEVKTNHGEKVEERKRKHSGGNKEEDMLHLAMHNILLQGIIGHMDLNDVYKKIHQLVNNFKKPGDNVEGQEHLKDTDKSRNEFTKYFTLAPTTDDFIENTDQPKTSSLENLPKPRGSKIKVPRHPNEPNEESKFFDEIAECDKLQNEIEKGTKQLADTKDIKKDVKFPNVMIKTIIDITSNNKQNHNYSDSKENVKGIIQLIYNGKPVKFNRVDQDLKLEETFTKKITEPTTERITTTILHSRTPSESQIDDVIDNLQDKYQIHSNSESYLSNLIGNFMKKNPKRVNNIMEEIETKRKYKTKRYKRQIKIRYEDSDANTENGKPKRKSLHNSDDDELYVEIETHFDSKGLKGEKKKKIIRNLIKKIKKAIHSDIDIISEEKKKKYKQYHVKKRTQHPLDKNRTLLVNKVVRPNDAIVKRQSDPISKSVTDNQPIPFIADKSGETWKRSYPGPGFLTVSKSLNSAELSEVDVDYNKVIKMNGIPQRLQKPLNTEMSEETSNSNTYFDLGNLKFFIKDLDGTGLSIGFNQYTDEHPDPETMKVFTGIENIITSYHQSDEEEQEKNNHENKSNSNSFTEIEHDISKRGVTRNNEHVVIRRSTQELNNEDYHSNEYKFIFDSNFVPYDNYEQIIEDKNKKVAISINKNNENIKPFVEIDGASKDINNGELPGVIGDNIFYKKLKPSEILSLASMLNRKKRAMTVKKITNFRNKIKLNKYINTNKMGRKKLILKKNRRKRQIDKIRIIATDALTKGTQSAENIFLVSNENLLANRAIMREVETPETISVTEMATLKSDNNYPNIIPYTYDETPIVNGFENKYRHNSLMSKYPHIFMDDISRSNEEYDPIVVNKIEIKPFKHLHKHRIEPTTQPSTTVDTTLHNMEEIIGAISPSPKQNYKLTVRIMPKNMSDLNSGFKEIHTSINKTFNKNGVLYSSLVNVSEISKIEKLHNLLNGIATTTSPLSLTLKSPFAKKMEEQQTKMEILLKQHKKRIEEQLEHLKRERINLEAIALKNMQERPDETFTFVSNKPPLLPQIDKIDIGRLLASALLHLQSDATTTAKATTTPTTTVVTITKQPDQEKTQIISTIQKNENLTNEILHQINRNTEILQTFLAKLADRITKEPVNQASLEIKPKFDDPNMLWRQYSVPFMANAEFSRNNTAGQIPFIYAFQQPHNADKPNIPIASVIYHGHIHTNEFQKPNVPNDHWQHKKKPLEGNGNQSRYFIDDLNSEFKILPSKKKQDSPMLLTPKNNTSVH